MEFNLESYLASSPPPAKSSLPHDRDQLEEGVRLSQTFRPAANAPKRGPLQYGSGSLPVDDPSPPAVSRRVSSEASELKADVVNAPPEVRLVLGIDASEILSHSRSAEVAAPHPGIPIAPTKERGFGRWTVDKRTRKRVYVSLSGRRLMNREAMAEFRRDQLALSSPSQSARRELEQLTAQFDQLTRSGIQLDRHSATSLLFWGIPGVTVARYAKAGVKTLFEWQVDCLLSDEGRVLRGGNMVYTAPTSGGKTLIAEVLMLRRLANTSGTIFFVVPFVALVEEKAEHLREVWQDLCVSVKVFHSEDGGDELPEDTDVCVCTIEKANMLFNGLMELQREQQLSMLVIDEMVNI